VGLVVEIQAVVDQFVEIDLGRAIKTALTSAVAAGTAVATSITTAVARTTASVATAPTVTATTLRAILAVSVSLLSCLLFRHVDSIPISI
jgi:hypothetical protein